MNIQNALETLKAKGYEITQDQLETELAAIALYPNDEGEVEGLTEAILLEAAQGYEPKAIAPAKGKRGGLSKSKKQEAAVAPAAAAVEPQAPAGNGVEQAFSQSAVDIQEFLRGVNDASYEMADRGSDAAIAIASSTSDRFLQMLAQKSGQYQGNPDGFFRLGQQFAASYQFD